MNVVSPDSSNAAAVSAAAAAAAVTNNNDDENNSDDELKGNETNDTVGVRIRLDNRLKPKSATAVINKNSLQNCETTSAAVRSMKFVDNHHYDPAILQAMLDQGKSNIDSMPVDLIRDLGLIDNGYTNADLFHGKVPEGNTSPVYVPVPSYKNAKHDYKLVSNRWRLKL